MVCIWKKKQPDLFSCSLFAVFVLVLHPQNPACFHVVFSWLFGVLCGETIIMIIDLKIFFQLTLCDLHDAIYKFVLTGLQLVNLIIVMLLDFMKGVIFSLWITILTGLQLHLFQTIDSLDHSCVGLSITLKLVMHSPDNHAFFELCSSMQLLKKRDSSDPKKP